MGILIPKNIQEEPNIQIAMNQDAPNSTNEGDNRNNCRKYVPKPVSDVSTRKIGTRQDLGKTQLSNTSSNLKGENELKKKESPPNAEMQWVHKMAKQRNIDTSQYEYNVLKKMMLDEHYKGQWNKSKLQKSTRRMNTTHTNTDMSTDEQCESNESRRPKSNISKAQNSERKESSVFTQNDFISLQRGTQWRMQIKQSQRKGIQKIEPKFKSM